MSSVAIPLCADPTEERRMYTRLRLPSTNPPIRLGRVDATLVDVSAAGARVRHPAALRIGSTVPISFTLGAATFLVSARVLASHVVLLGNQLSSAMLYESRFVFARVADLEQAVLSAAAERRIGEGGVLRPRFWNGALSANQA